MNRPLEDPIARNALERTIALLELSECWALEPQDALLRAGGITIDSPEQIELVVSDTPELPEGAVSTGRRKDLLVVSVIAAGKEAARVEYYKDLSPAGTFEIPSKDPDKPWLRLGLNFGSVYRLREAVENARRPQLEDVDTARVAEPSTSPPSPDIS